MSIVSSWLFLVLNLKKLDILPGVEEIFCEVYKSYIEQKISEHNKAKS